MPKSRGRKKRSFAPVVPGPTYVGTTVAPVHGNREVVELCELVLEEARKGQFSHFAFCATQFPDRVCMAHAGATGEVGKIQVGLNTLHGQLEERMQARKSGFTTSGANLHEYNLATDPMNFDFLIWLIEAEMIRRREGAPPPLLIKFSHIETLNEKGRLFFEAVHRPLIPLIGAVEDQSSSGGWRKAMFTPSEIVAACKRGEKVPVLHSNDVARDLVDNWLHGKPQPITITLREASHWSHRNSNVANWVKFGRYLRDKGEFVVFLRDTEKANEPLEDFTTFPQGSFCVQRRMALYEKAKINLFTSNGPAGLGLFSDRPYLYFIDVYKDERYPANNPEWWPQNNGIGRGEQWPWALPTQKMIWKPDTYENIVEAWEGRDD